MEDLFRCSMTTVARGVRAVPLGVPAWSRIHGRNEPPSTVWGWRTSHGGNLAWHVN